MLHNLVVLLTDLLKPSAVRKTYSLEFLSSDGKDACISYLISLLVIQRTVDLSLIPLRLGDLRYWWLLW